MREGYLRCQGAFRHSILAGIFGATQFPLFVALWTYRREYRLLSISAMICSIIIVICAHSSGGLMALLAGIGGLALWRWRKHMRLIRWGVLGLIFALAIVMKAPVWYLLARLSDVTGGGGWHRAWLIDQSIAYFDEWWLFGTTYTAHWGPAGEFTAGDPNMMDITNHFIAEGVKGGVLKLGLFIALIISCFRIIGQRLHTEVPNSSDKFFLWAIGVSFFAHCLSFISATYFDQTILVWYWLQASICCIANKSPLSLESDVTSRFTVDAKYFRYSLPQEATTARRRGNTTFRYKEGKV
jgi:hypothetical protein